MHDHENISYHRGLVITMNGSEGDDHTYKYSICGNLESCEGQNAMTTQTEMEMKKCVGF